MKRPLSMTAFGRGEQTYGTTTWIVEIRSVNHRFCDIKVKMPRKYGVLEDRIKKELTGDYSRGHVEVAISYNGSEETATSLKTNIALARQYHNCLQELHQALTPDSPPDLAMIAAYKDVIVSEDQEENLEDLWSEGLQPAVRMALAECLHMREAEGENLQKDLRERLAIIVSAGGRIESMIPQLLQERGAALKERLQNLLEGSEIDPARLAAEVAIMADKSDVTEELVRLNSHVSQFENFLGMSEPVGRRLDFLLQEFLREINTLASKISNAEVAHLSVELKNEIEKMREQVQNIE